MIGDHKILRGSGRAADHLNGMKCLIGRLADDTERHQQQDIKHTQPQIADHFHFRSRVLQFPDNHHEALHAGVTRLISV
jgi:hypothetical protein